MSPYEEHPRGALHAYLDGELSLEGSLAVEEHLKTCDPCRRQLETFRALSELLHAARPVPAEGETALERFERTLRSDEARTRRRRTSIRGGLLAAAMAAAIVTGVVTWSHRPSPVEAEVAQVHARALESGRSVELASADPVALGPWLQSRVRYPVHPAAGGDGFALRGARVESLRGEPVATVVYQVRNHLIDVFAWPSGEGDSDPKPTLAGRWTICRWAHKGVAYWMVSDASTDDLKKLAALIKVQRS
jgi:anti-sigma factor RsiW